MSSFIYFQIQQRSWQVNDSPRGAGESFIYVAGACCIFMLLSPYRWRSQLVPLTISAGILGVFFSVLWMLFINSSPLEHHRISKDEKEYILETLTGEALLSCECLKNILLFVF